MEELRFTDLYTMRRFENKLQKSIKDSKKSDKGRGKRAPTGYSDLRGKAKKGDFTRVPDVCDTDTKKQLCTRHSCRFKHPFKDACMAKVKAEF